MTRRCTLCAPNACSCVAASTRGDLESARWAAERGVKLEGFAHKEGLCGDRFPSAEKRLSVADGIYNSAAMRNYRELARLRAAEIARLLATLPAELARLERHVKFVDLLLDGDGMDMYQIAAAFGRKSHSSASALRAEVENAARVALGKAQNIGQKCERPRCMQTVARLAAGGGRPARYCCDQCATEHRQAMWRQTRRVGAIRRSTVEFPSQNSDAGRTG
jgi:hypothetical protein